MKNDVEMKQDCDVLKRIAAHYPDGSEEVLVLKKAATALQLVCLKGFGTELDQHLAGTGEPLTKEQRDSLGRMGIE